MSDLSSKANESHENFIAMGDFNVDISISNSDHNKLEQFCSLFDLQSLIKKETCIIKVHKSTIALMNLSLGSRNLIKLLKTY